MSYTTCAEEFHLETGMMLRLNQMIVMMLPAVVLIGHQSTADPTTTPEIPPMAVLPHLHGLTDAAHLGLHTIACSDCIIPLRLNKKKKRGFDLKNRCCIITYSLQENDQQNRAMLAYIHSINCFSNCKHAYKLFNIDERKTCVKEALADAVWDGFGKYDIQRQLFCSRRDNKCLSLEVDPNIYIQNCCSISKKILEYKCKSYKKCKKQSLIE
ncbi:unnamed protein product [Owenia fusiformis]|uniref:Uncharacterized protein n=1 Tax=Owenia fusiformis TaxID=6347 RepID=A0A8J1THR0_OWEFU|nr:unnamed protein product [Owenia fusiformis]